MNNGTQHALIVTTLFFEAAYQLDGAPHFDPSDPGGATQWGISSRAHPELAATIQQGKLSLTQAVEVAKKKYLHHIPTILEDNSIPDSIAFLLFDDLFHGKNLDLSGIIQKYVNVVRNTDLKVDGNVGPKTATLLRNFSPKEEAGLLILLNATIERMAKKKAEAVLRYQKMKGLPAYDYTQGFIHRYEWRVARATGLLHAD
jgi:lysozyme family protein